MGLNNRITLTRRFNEEGGGKESYEHYAVFVGEEMIRDYYVYVMYPIKAKHALEMAIKDLLFGILYMTAYERNARQSRQAANNMYSLAVNCGISSVDFETGNRVFYDDE